MAVAPYAPATSTAAAPADTAGVTSMTDLIVEIKEYSRDIEGSWDPEDEWDYPDQEYSFLGLRARIVRKLDEYKTHTLPDVRSGDQIFVITANYNSGCSFNTSYGHTAVAGVYASRGVARERYEVLKDNPEAGEDEYFPWQGYFETLNHFDIRSVIVE